MWKTNAATAIASLGQSYADLSVAAHLILKQSKLTGQPIPCKILDSYNQAVNNYMSQGNELFKLLHDNEMQVEQVVFTQGKVAKRPDGSVRTYRISQPLRPPKFLLTKTKCPGITQVVFSGAHEMGGAVEMGIAPAILAGYAIKGILIYAIGKYVAIPLLKEITVLLRGRDFTPEEVVKANAKCLQDATKHVKNLHPDMDPAARDQLAAQLALKCGEQAKGVIGGGGFSVGILAAGAAAAGAFLILRK